SRAVREGSQADTHDLGVVNIHTVEPGVTGNMIFDYAFAAEGVFDPVRAWRMGDGFDLPLMPRYVATAPVVLEHGFFSIDQPNVAIVTVKTLSDNVIRGEVSSAPLDPVVSKVFIIRLQEFAGRAASVKLGLPVKIKSASVVNLTEEKVLSDINQTTPLTVSIKPYQTLTIRIETD
ncbi:MAG: glycosyl hydrolase-related protein, partial [Pyrinomonadaceae bacterium]